MSTEIKKTPMKNPDENTYTRNLCYCGASWDTEHSWNHGEEKEWHKTGCSNLKEIPEGK